MMTLWGAVWHHRRSDMVPTVLTAIVYRCTEYTAGWGSGSESSMPSCNVVHLQAAVHEYSYVE